MTLLAEDWDGVTERRKNRQRRVIEVPTTAMLLIGVTIILFQVAALLGHGSLGHLHEEKAERDTLFQESITCYVIKATNSQLSPDVLTDCGFVNVPTSVRREPSE